MSSRVFGAALFQISDRFCPAGTVKTTDGSFQKQSAKGQSGMTGKNGSKGKANSKGYHRLNKNFHKVSKDFNFTTFLPAPARARQSARATSKAPMARASRGHDDVLFKITSALLGIYTTSVML